MRFDGASQPQPYYGHRVYYGQGYYYHPSYCTPGLDGEKVFSPEMICRSSSSEWSIHAYSNDAEWRSDKGGSAVLVEHRRTATQFLAVHKPDLGFARRTVVPQDVPVDLSLDITLCCLFWSAAGLSFVIADLYTPRTTRMCSPTFRNSTKSGCCRDILPFS